MRQQAKAGGSDLRRILDGFHRLELAVVDLVGRTADLEGQVEALKDKVGEKNEKAAKDFTNIETNLKEIKTKQSALAKEDSVSELKIKVKQVSVSMTAMPRSTPPASGRRRPRRW